MTYRTVLSVHAAWLIYCLVDQLIDWLIAWLINMLSIWSQVGTQCVSGISRITMPNAYTDWKQIRERLPTADVTTPFYELRRSKKRDEDKETGPASSHYLRRYSTATTSSMRGLEMRVITISKVPRRYSARLYESVSINEFTFYN